MTLDWSPLRNELALWRRDGNALPLWWRDDDAMEPTAALDRLLDLGETLALPVHLAIVPAKATPALAKRLEHAHAVALVHGWAHQNHAPEGAKKAEFGHPRAQAQSETAQALARLEQLFGPKLFRMFVPPWNRVDPDLVAALAPQGYAALSTFTPRSKRETAGLVQINTHIDPIHWKAAGGLVAPRTVIAILVQTLQDRRSGATDAREPLGFLTHHLVHDDAIWDFTRACLSELLDGGAEPCNLLDMKDNLP